MQSLTRYAGYVPFQPAWHCFIPQVRIPRIDATARRIHYLSLVVLILECSKQFGVYVVVHSCLAGQHLAIKILKEPWELYT